MNYPNSKSGNVPKKGLLQLNLIVFGIVALVIALVSYQVGNDISSQLTLTNQQTGGLASGADAAVIPAEPLTPEPNPASLPAVSTTIVAPPANRGKTLIANPTPAATAPPPPPVSVKPTTAAVPKAQVNPVTARPAPTTKAS